MNRISMKKRHILTIHDTFLTIFLNDIFMKNHGLVLNKFFIKSPHTKLPLGMSPNGETPPQADYYCGVGHGNCYGRPLAEDVLSHCLYSGLYITGLNFEVAPGQCEFQIRGEGITACDELFKYFDIFLFGLLKNIQLQLIFTPNQ